ncbi:MAG: hypothetical protein LCH54_02965 [Bacteroidetes bacterium]|nr:hypothetical protein [Bacteroidota bacterium]
MNSDDKKWVRLLLHDLRNPLAEIQTGIQIRKMENENTGSADDSFLDDSILQSVKNMALLLDMVQLMVRSDTETETPILVSIPEILTHYPVYLEQRVPGLLQSCIIEPFETSAPVLVHPGILDLALTGLVVFANQVKMDDSLVQISGKMNQIYVSWKEINPVTYSNSLFNENGQINQKKSKLVAGSGIPLVFAHYAVNEILKGSVCFQTDTISESVTVVISLQVGGKENSTIGL